MTRLSRAERALIYRCLQFVLAGEWPWETDDVGEVLSDDQIECNREALKRAAEKL